MDIGARWRVEIRGEHLVGYGPPPPLPSVELLWAAHRRREQEQARRASYRKEWGMAPPTGSAAYPLHLRFARLHGQDDEAIRRFAQRFGLLGLVKRTTAPYIEAMGRVSALLGASESETLPDVERRYQREREAAALRVLEEVMQRRAAREPERPVRAPREPLVEWRREVAQVWALVKLVQVADALERGEAVPASQVRSALVALGSARMAEAWDTATPLARVERSIGLQALVAHVINARGPLRYQMHVTKDGMAQEPICETLLEAIYASFAMALDGRLPVRFCKACGRPFLPTRADQEFCPPEDGGTSLCGQRHRQRERRRRKREVPPESAARNAPDEAATAP